MQTADWLYPAVIATLFGTIILACVYGYLYLTEKSRFLGIWAIGWLLYAGRFVFALILIDHPSPVFFIFNQLLTLASGLLLLLGTQMFIKRVINRLVYYAIAAGGTAWIVLSGVLDIPFFWATVPTFLLLGAIYAWTGISMFLVKDINGFGQKLTGVSFIVWGLHKANYPFLRPVLWLAPWGFLVGAILEFLVAIGILVICFDKTRQELNWSETRARHIIQASLDAIIAVNREGKVLVYNKAAETLFGRPVKEVLNQNLELLIPPELRVQHRTYISSYFATGKPNAAIGKTLELETERPNGQRVPVELSLADAAYKAEKLVIANVRDISARKQAEMERDLLETKLRQSQRLESLGRLAGGIAHDFNNLLTSITGNVSLAQLEDIDNPDLNETLDEIAMAADRAANLTKQLLTFSRKQLIQPKALDLNALVSSMEKMLLRIIGEDVEISTRLDEVQCTVLADRGQLEQVIINLVLNARDAINDAKDTRHGRILIDTQKLVLDEEFCHNFEELQPGDYIRLQISDNGLGMSEEVRNNIFEPFFTTKKEGKGTGLGLATVYGITKQHNAQITVESDPDKGSRFIIYFPFIAHDLTEAKPRIGDSEMPRGTEQILVVEDEKTVRDVAVKTLSRLGYRIMAAEDGLQAIEMMKDHEPVDLLLTDVIMPRMNGRELAENLQPQFPEMKVLFCSGYSHNVMGDHGVLDETINFLEKPYTPQILSATVRAVLDGN